MGNANLCADRQDTNNITMITEKEKISKYIIFIYL